jgi:putative protease
MKFDNKRIIVKPEVMSPAGYWPQLHAAVEAGADAVYFGLKHFTARAKVGFSLSELPEVVATLHRRGVRGYVTFNTLVFDHELAEAARSLAEIAATGIDAIIVQDIGIAQLAKQIAPDLEVHGSTQMSITSAEGVRLAQEFGVSRVVLARELSLDEIRAIRQQTDCELEMFVHGALCVSYSGQCFSSEAWGGRSANRGQCAQACRLPYEMIVDGELRPLADARYLLSPGDLYALHQLPEIVQIGISALKIEGRYKDADYVALTTAAYRKTVDEAFAGLPLSATAADDLQLEQVFSRGLGPYFVSGTNHQEVVKGRTPRHRGVQMGRVVRVLGDRVVLSPAEAHAVAPLKPGDGVVFDAADWRSPQEREEGGRIYQVTTLANGRLEVQFGNGVVNFARVRPGDLLWRTHDPALDKLVRAYTEAPAPVHKQGVRVRATAHEGEPLRLEWSMVARPEVQTVVSSATPLVPAANRELDAAGLREQLGRLGNTAYELQALELIVQGRPFVPASLLNQLRRQAVELLAEQQAQTTLPQVSAPGKVLAGAIDAAVKGAGAPARSAADSATAWAASVPAPTNLPQLHLLVRTPEQLDAALDIAKHLALGSITLDYLDLYGLRPAVERVQAAGIAARVASPRVLKPDEQRIVNFLRRLNCQVLVRSGGLLEAFRDGERPALVGDFSLNAANVLSAATYLQLGIERLTPTHDLNAAQVAELARELGPGKIEVIAYQHLPVFHTEHCVFCRFLSTGTSYKDCGHPCEKHQVALRDDQGRVHPVMADVGCRNTVFGAQAQEASRHLDLWRQAGVQHYRLEFVHESAAEVREVAEAFAQALTGRITAGELTRRLQRIAPQGTTEGSLFVAADYLELPLMQ